VSALCGHGQDLRPTASGPSPFVGSLALGDPEGRTVAVEGLMFRHPLPSLPGRRAHRRGGPGETNSGPPPTGPGRGVMRGEPLETRPAS
jgi:hypothetical protein